MLLMLRASSLGLRCYRHTLHRGALRCSVHRAPARHQQHLAAARATPDISDDRGQLDRTEGAQGSAEPGHVVEGPDDVHEASDAPPFTRSPAGEESASVRRVRSANSAYGSRERPPIPPLTSRRRVPVFTLPDSVTVVSQGPGKQPADDAMSIRERFEKNLQAVPKAKQKLPGIMRAGSPAAKRNVLTDSPQDMDSPDPPDADLQSRSLNLEDASPDEVFQVRRKCHATLATTDSVSDAWEAYHTLMSLPRIEGRIPVPWQHLHRLARLIARTVPRTRTLFIRLLSVISTIHRTGGTVKLWEWNALTDFAGKGFRKASANDFRNALNVYHDLISNRPPGASFSPNKAALEAMGDENDPRTQHEPDIVTLTTLLNIAASTAQPTLFRRAWNLLESSGLPANRITYLVLLRYHTKCRSLLRFRSVLATMATQGMELGIEGANACLWAFASNNRFDIAEPIYLVLRANLSQEPSPEVEQLREKLATEHIYLPTDVGPDHITYVSLIQAFAYHGHLDACLTVFMDLITAVISPSETGAPDARKTKLYLPAYRAIFLGFVRHARDPRVVQDTLYGSPLHSPGADDAPSRWTLDVLQELFNDFLRIPHEVQPTERLIFWVLTAFAKTSGEDVKTMCTVYERLEERFGGGWGGRLARLKERLDSDEGRRRVEWDVETDVEIGDDDYTD